MRYINLLTYLLLLLRASTSATGQSSSVRYVDTCTPGLIVWMQSALEPSASAAVLEPRRGKDEPSGGVHHWLQPWQEMWWNAGECRIAVVQPREDERRHQRLKNRFRHWPADSPQLTQYRVAGRYRFRDVRPHRDIAVDVNSKVSNGGSWKTRSGNCGSWWRRRLVVDQRKKGKQGLVD